MNVYGVLANLSAFMHGSRKFCQRVSNFSFFYFLIQREDPNTTKSEPSPAKHHLNGVDDGSTLSAGLVAL